MSLHLQQAVASLAFLKGNKGVTPMQPEHACEQLLTGMKYELCANLGKEYKEFKKEHADLSGPQAAEAFAAKKAQDLKSFISANPNLKESVALAGLPDEKLHETISKSVAQRLEKHTDCRKDMNEGAANETHAAGKERRIAALTASASRAFQPENKPKLEPTEISSLDSKKIIDTLNAFNEGLEPSKDSPEAAIAAHIKASGVDLKDKEAVKAALSKIIEMDGAAAGISIHEQLAENVAQAIAAANAPTNSPSMVQKADPEKIFQLWHGKEAVTSDTPEGAIVKHLRDLNVDLSNKEEVQKALSEGIPMVKDGKSAGTVLLDKESIDAICEAFATPSVNVATPLEKFNEVMKSVEGKGVNKNLTEPGDREMMDQAYVLYRAKKDGPQFLKNLEAHANSADSKYRLAAKRLLGAAEKMGLVTRDQEGALNLVPDEQISFGEFASRVQELKQKAGI